MCFGGGGSGPQSKADIAAGGYRPGASAKSATPAGNPNIAMRQGAYDSSQSSATVSKQTADRNTMRRADSYGSRQAASKPATSSAAQGGRNIMSALNNYNKANKKTILGS